MSLINQALLARYRTQVSQYRKENQPPASWDQQLVEIFEHDVVGTESVYPGRKIGEYVRNYSSYGTATFYPFEQDGKHYALYSSRYTATRVMTLPDCKDLCGETPDAFGFCPTGYYVPHFTYEWQGPVDPNDLDPTDNPNWAGPDVIAAGFVQEIMVDGKKSYARPMDKQYTGARTKEEFKVALDDFFRRSHEWDDRHPYRTDTFNSEFGFVCGCIWGDDTSWKIQFLDLSRIRDGVLVRDARFGYLEMPNGSEDLPTLINLVHWTPIEPTIIIASAAHYRTDQTGPKESA